MNAEILPQLLVNALITGSLYAIASGGLSLSYGVFRILNFAHGHLMMVGAYVFYFLVLEAQFSGLLLALLYLLFLVVACVLTGIFFIFPFQRLSFVLTFVSTLTLGTILESAVSLYFGVNVLALPNLFETRSYAIGSVYITPMQIVIISLSVSVLFFLALLIHATSLGRYIRALSENPEAAETLGVDRRRLSYFVLFLAIAMAALAGVLVAFETNLQPTMGTVFTIKAFAAMVLGGLGNLWGTILAAYALGLIENLSIGLDFFGYSLPAGYKDAFSFLIILLFLLFKPEGLLGKKSRRI